MKTVHNIDTRISNKKDASASDKAVHKTALTIDWTGCTEDDLRPAAAQTLVINRQGQYRRNKSIPQVDVLVAKEVLSGMGRSAPLTKDGIVAAVTAGVLKPEEVEQLIADLRKQQQATAKAAKATPPAAEKRAGKGGDGNEART